MRFASIDIGTNTLLMLIADVLPDGTIIPLHHEQRLPRLGRDVDSLGTIRPGAFDRIAWIINDFLAIAKQHAADHVIACATSAVRDARNGAEFTSHIRRTTGLELEVLTGNQEAEYTFIGATSGFRSFERPVAVIDIGGGSTELSYRKPGTTNGDLHLEQYSMQIGAVRLTERFLSSLPPARADLASAADLVHEELAAIRNPGFFQYQLIGVAGTVTTLACLDLNMKHFDVERLSGYVMPLEKVNGWFQRLSSLRSEEIAGLSFATIGREDILTAGILILREAMQTLGFGSVTVSERGLRYGYLLSKWKQLPPEARK
jgi:exopolyphosphatase/guanosine-5'-triphosphate,3'-diphosphate pyrophosphatase